MSENEMKKKLVLTLLLYLFIGLLFTIFRANAYYNHFLVEEDSLEDNGNSYWENRCIESNRDNPVPLAQWCVDGFDKFHIDEPTRISWYFYLYLKKPSDFLITLILWPLHFLGIDIINFRGIGYGL